MRIKGAFKLQEIKLDENGKVPTRVQVLRVGNFSHPRYGKFQITTATLTEMKKNFDERVRGIDTAFDYFHDSDKEASAWVNSLELSEDGKELWADVTWTPTAEKKLAERELRYFSPDFAFQWQDPESGNKFKNVLFGGGLTNRPFVKEMAAIVASEQNNEGENMTELEKAQAQVKKLSEDYQAMEKKLEEVQGGGNAAEEALKAQIKELQDKLAAMQGENEKMLAEKAKADEAVKCAELERDFNVMLTEGKACAAQKDAFIKGDMKEFIKLAQPLNMKQNGEGASKETTGEDREDKILKLAEEKRKSNSKLSVSESISLASKEVK